MTNQSTSKARKATIPTLVITKVCDDGAKDSVAVANAKEPYSVQPVYIPQEDLRHDGLPKWMPARFNNFPIVLQGDGAPWAEANLYLLSELENALDPDMRTYDTRALDLASLRRFVENENLDWTNFSQSMKLLRPTYRYRSHVNNALYLGEISAETARRRIGTAASFYKWLMAESIVVPKYPLWIEKDIYITVHDTYGFGHTKKVKSTDLAIRVPKNDNPYDEHVSDEGQLRPLPIEEQKWLTDALKAANNPEMNLIFIMGLATGARLQSICTIKVRHFLKPVNKKLLDVKLAIGPGTGIDTKGDMGFPRFHGHIL